MVVESKARAGELPATQDCPLSRGSSGELARCACQSGLVASLSGRTVWRWLHEDAIRPWQHRGWVFPRDPALATKASRLLDLSERVWPGQPWQADEFVLSADEKTRIPARRRQHATRPPRPESALQVEHEYERCGAWAYLAALDVHRAQLFGRCESKTGSEPFDRLVEQVMSPPP